MAATRAAMTRGGDSVRSKTALGAIGADEDLECDVTGIAPARAQGFARALPNGKGRSLSGAALSRITSGEDQCVLATALSELSVSLVPSAKRVPV
jgi:hypothetical protein